MKILQMAPDGLIASFDEGILKGMSVRFCIEMSAIDNAFSVYSWSGEVIRSNSMELTTYDFMDDEFARKLSDEEFRYIKTTILAHIKAENKAKKEDLKVKFTRK